MKLKITLVLLLTVAHWLVDVRSVQACTESTTAIASGLIKDGRHDEAVALLQACIQNGDGKPEAHFQLGAGLLYMSQYEAAERQFALARSQDADYDAHIGRLWIQLGVKEVKRGKVKDARFLFKKAVGYQPVLGSEAAAVSFRKGAGTLGTAYFDLAVELDPDYRAKIFDYLLAKANKAPDKKCIRLYQLAANYCGETCTQIQLATKRLTEMAADIEAANPLDKRIGKLMDTSRQFAHWPPDIKTYSPGIYPFKLAKGELTHWIRCKGKEKREFEFRSDNQKYEVFLKNGRSYRAWAGEAFPKTIDSDLKIRAAEDTVIFVTIR